MNKTQKLVTPENYIVHLETQVWAQRQTIEAYRRKLEDLRKENKELKRKE